MLVTELTPTFSQCAAHPELIVFPAREPTLYPRFNERYCASVVEDANGLRFEFAHNPPREAPPA